MSERKLQRATGRAQLALRLMRLARWMAEKLPLDHEKRVIGRLVFIYAPIVVEELFVLTRTSGLTPAQKRSVRERIRALRDDLDSYHGRIRDDLTAHRDELTLIELIDLWNEIDASTLEWFVTNGESIFVELADDHVRLVGHFVPFATEDRNDLADVLRTLKIQNDERTRVSTDALAPTRGDVFTIPTCDVQSSAARLMSIRDTLTIGCGIHEALHDLPCQLMLRSMIVIDAVNLLDELFGPVVGASKHRGRSMLEVMEEDDFEGAPVLRESVEHLDHERIKQLRRVRNKACAHFESGWSTERITRRVLDHDIGADLRDLIDPAWAALMDACSREITTRWLLLEDVSLSGLTPTHTPGVKAFND